MSRSTIDFGIDLGTTNSAIAVLNGVEPEIIKNSEDQDITPSAVWINRQDIVRIGSRAKGATVGEREENNAYTEFKRQMGTPHIYEFASSGKKKKAEELSAEVLKDLRASVESKTGELIQSIVITVPAAFELHQCDATRRAAELAGFKNSSLLQEPVAAALAYGFQIDSEKAYWLVYDFGGGTFDAALIKAEEGMINVVHHGGDNFLGGSDIDWAVVEKLIIPHLTTHYDLPGFARGSDRWKLKLERLKHEVERAKIELSTKETTNLSGGMAFEDAAGELIDCDAITISRDDLIRIARPLVARSIEISLRVLKEKNLDAKAVQKVIVVGGPTKATYFREMLSEGLGIPIDFSLDPLTVVARGAAVFASTQKTDAKLRTKALTGEFNVQISEKYKTVGHDNEPLIAGKVTSPGNVSISGFSIEFINPDSKWRSGRIPLNSEAAFMANLFAEKGSRNTFKIELTNPQGELQKAVPDHVVYTIGAVIEEQPLLKSIGLEKAGNSVDTFFKAGMGLPQTKRWPTSHRTTVELKANDANSVIKLPIIEGENPLADRNRLIGFVEISGTDVNRDLPAGSDIEITLRIDESRTLRLEAYFPILDLDITKQLNIEKAAAAAGFIVEAHIKEKERLQEIREQAEEVNDSDIIQQINQLEADSELNDAVKAAKGDPDAAEKAQARLVELQNKLDAAEEKLKWPALVTEAKELQERLTKLATDHGDKRQQEAAEDWCDTVNSIISKEHKDRLARKIEEGENLHSQILVSIPAFWVGCFRRLENDGGNFSEPNAAERLFERGRSFLRENNVDGLQDVVRKLWNLLPKEQAEQQQRGFGSNII